MAPNATRPETLSYRVDLGTPNSSAALLIVQPSETALAASLRSSSDHCLKGTHLRMAGERIECDLRMSRPYLGRDRLKKCRN